tara:strand:+ start:585 stop:1301 length:717 start_codon:yes stop_codon:yes gene_type:complete
MKIDKKIKIRSNKRQWTFSNIAYKFENHIIKSIPFYDYAQDLVCSLSENFLLENKTIFTEIGTSTGRLARKLSNHHKLKNDLQIEALDIEKSMIRHAKLLSKKNKNINYKVLDITKKKLKKSECIFSYYTMQFIPQKNRQKVLNKIFDSLQWGGGFFIFEKIRGKNARFHDYFLEVYNDFKSQNGFTDNEIMNKTRSLRGVMDPFTEQGNVEMLSRAGFKDITSIFQWGNFKGWLAIK